MKSKLKFYFLIGILMFARAFIESGIIQIEINKESYSEFVFCGGLGCFLTFKYQFILEIISFTFYYIFGRKTLNLSKKNSIIIAVVYVGVFMLTGFYHIVGSPIFYFIPEIFLPNIKTNTALFWSIQGFIGILISFLIMTLSIKLIRKFVIRTS